MAYLELSKVELPESIREFVARRRDRYPTVKALLVPALMECQKYFGQVTPEIGRAVAELLDQPFPEVMSVVSFYTMFLERRTGKYLIGVCGTWNCAHAGAQELIRHFCDKYECEEGDIAAGGQFTITHVECLCDCQNAPSVQFLMFGDDFEATWCNNLTVDIFDAVLDDLLAGKPDAMRERLVRIEDKLNPPDDRKWIWLVTTRNQYPAWLEKDGPDYTVHDALGKLAGLKQHNPKLHAEINAALMIKR